MSSTILKLETDSSDALIPDMVVARKAKHLLRALSGTDITVFYQDTDLKYQWIENPPIGWTVDDIIGKDDFAILPPDTANRVAEVKRFAIATHSHQSIELFVDVGEYGRWFDLSIEPDIDEDDETVVGVVCFSVETTDKKRKEESLRALLLEISHRSRNLLSIVQSIARYTFATPDNKVGMQQFDERLRSLSASLGIVVDAEWEGSSLCNLVEAQTILYSDDNMGCVVQGMNPILVPNAALHLGLAVQELSASHVRRNKHDYMDMESVRLSVTKQTDGDGVLFEWRENLQNKETTMIDADALILTRIVPSAICGEADIKTDDGKLVYSITVPSVNFV